MKSGLSRRQVLKGAAAGAIALGGLDQLVVGCSDGSGSDSLIDSLSGPELPDPEGSGIEHIVLVMMENRSFDHYFGWVPGADGRQAGLFYRDDDGTAVSTHRLQGFQGCGHPDPDHSQKGGLVQLNHGANDGWLRSGSNDEYAIGYYTDDDLPFFRQAVSNYTVCDRYFTALMASTFPNRVF